MLRKKFIVIVSVVAIIIVAGILFYTCYHKWDETTCSKEGRREAICVRYNETISESIDKIEHAIGDWEVKTDYVISPQAFITPGEETQNVKQAVLYAKKNGVGESRTS